MTVAVCFPACSFLRFRIYAQTHFLAYPHFYGGLGLVPHRCAVVRRYVNTSARMYVNASVRMYVSTSAELCVCPSVRTCLFKCLFPSMFIYLPCCFIVSVRKWNIQIRRSVSFPPCVAAFGFVPVACGVLQPLPSAFLPRTFAPKRQGNAPDAHTAPRLRPSFGQQEGIGRPIPLGLVTGRSIPNPSCTDSCVLKDTARCPLSYSKGFRLLPETTLPLAGEGFPSEVGKPFRTAVL